MTSPVYLDHNATTPLDPRVLEAMLPFLRENFGNASSRHEFGRVTRDALDRARQQVAAVVAAHPTEVLFTSGGTEANNLFLKGAAACLGKGIVAVSAVEHPSVLEPAAQLVRQGWTLDTLAVDGDGRVDGKDYARAMGRRPRLLSVMLANNETGTVQPVAELVAARAPGACFHCDAVQALGKLDVDFRALGVNAMTLSAHKIGGPKGAGALIVDKRVELLPLLAGGGHERGLRSGTENVAAIVGFGKACELLGERLQRNRELVILRDHLEASLVGMGAVVFGGGSARLANTSFFALPGIDGETLVGKLDRAGYAVASGAACSSAHPESSHVLAAMGVTPEIARCAVRVSLGPESSAAEVTGFIASLKATTQSLRRLAPLAA